MKFAQIELTNLCNLSCAGCFRNSMKRKTGIMSLETFQRTLSVCAKMKLTDLWLHNWGEPLLHPDLIKFVALASRKFKVGFASNGTLLTIPTLMNLKDAGLSQLDLSLNKNVSYEHSKHLHGLYAVANSLGIDCRFRTMIYSQEDFKYWNDLLYDYKTRYQRFMISDKKKIRREDCSAIDKLFFVCFDGSVVPCCRVADKEIVYGNISDQDIVSKIKKGVKRIHSSIKLNKHKEICRHCSEISDDLPIDFKLSKSNR